jgi:hypothetical protein
LTAPAVPSTEFEVASDPRVTLAASIMVALQLEYSGSQVNLTQTTSGCPVVQVVTGETAFNITITLQRKPKQ